MTMQHNRRGDDRIEKFVLVFLYVQVVVQIYVRYCGYRV